MKAFKNGTWEENCSSLKRSVFKTTVVNRHMSLALGFVVHKLSADVTFPGIHNSVLVISSD